MKVIKPQTLGVLFRPYTHRRRHRLAVTALGFFALGGDDDALLPENVQWPQVLAELPEGEPLDAAMPKARGEVLLAGRAHAPGAQPVREMAVRLAVGEVDKRLKVIGDRRWSYGLLPLHEVSTPEPFTVMPLTWTRAYGGAAFAENPVGCGHTGERLGALTGRNEGAMPNFEYPAAPVRSHCGRYVPAGFGPLDLRWPQRQRHAGTYDARWLAEGFPGLADDVDFALFNAAPADQQLPGFLRGGESYRLEGFQPSGAIEGRLPALRVRAFLQRHDRSPLEAEEIALVADTLWLLPEARRGVLIYRGTAPIDDSDGLDAEALLLAYERAADAPRSLARYREALALRLDPQSAPAHFFNEAPLTPEPDAAERARRAAEDAAVEAEERAALEAKLAAARNEFATRSGSEAPAPRAAAPLLGPVPTAALARGDADLGALLARAREVAARAQAEGEARLAAASARLQACAVPPADDERLKKEAEQRAQRSGPTLPMPSGLAPDAQRAFEATATDAARLAQEARRLAPAPKGAPPSPAVAHHLGTVVRQWLAQGLSLAGRDLTGADLAGIDLHGADLHATVFEQADLSGAALAGADLRGAIFTGALLTAADLSGADLREANLSQVRAADARFTGASLAQALVQDADLIRARLDRADLTRVLAVGACFKEASLEGAELTGAVLQGGDLSGARLCGAHLARTILHKADLTGADLGGVRAERTVFAEATADQSRWVGARLRNSFLGYRTRFCGADLQALDAGGCGWRGADLTGADLRGADLSASDLGACRFDGARLDGALLARSVLAGSSFRAASAVRVDLFQALCRKSDWRGADLREANLYGATLMEAALDGARLDGARHSRQREVA